MIYILFNNIYDIYITGEIKKSLKKIITSEYIFYITNNRSIQLTLCLTYRNLDILIYDYIWNREFYKEFSKW